MNEDEPIPIMPHLLHDEIELKRRYPPLEVPAAVDAEDPLNDDADVLVQAGDVIIKDLLKAIATQGRRRRLEGEGLGSICRTLP